MKYKYKNIKYTFKNNYLYYDVNLKEKSYI